MDNKNVFVAIALSMSVLLFWGAFFDLLHAASRALFCGPGGAAPRARLGALGRLGEAFGFVFGCILAAKTGPEPLRGRAPREEPTSHAPRGRKGGEAGPPR